jgi:UDP-GlcNAc:undecaprenyl-phosphate GlcNAc-1-phosphate transferase
MVMCLLAVVGACNATNLLDGLDGLCGGVTGIIALGFLALSVWLATWVRYPDTEGLRIALCVAMVGAVLGFLPYNIPPASIFMGDAGSMLLGFFVATMMTLFCQEGNARWFLAACVIFALPILDTALAVVRRFLAGSSLFAGDRSHLYDQLVDRGMTVKQVVVLFYGLAVLADAMGVTVAICVQGRHAVILYGLVLAVIWLLFWKKGMIKPPAPHGPGPKSPAP